MSSISRTSYGNHGILIFVVVSVVMLSLGILWREQRFGQEESFEWGAVSNFEKVPQILTLGLDSP